MNESNAGLLAANESHSSARVSECVYAINVGLRAKNFVRSLFSRAGGWV